MSAKYITPTELETILDPHIGRINKTHEKLFGNGEIGFDERLRNVEAKLDTLIKLAWSVTLAVVGYVAVELLKLI